MTYLELWILEPCAATTLGVMIIARPNKSQESKDAVLSVIILILFA